MSKEEILSKVKNIIKPYAQDQEAVEHISESTNFFDDLKINSSNIVDVILDIESEYDIEIDNESMEKMITVGAAINIISEKINSK